MGSATHSSLPHSLTSALTSTTATAGERIVRVGAKSTFRLLEKSNRNKIPRLGKFVYYIKLCIKVSSSFWPEFTMSKPIQDKLKAKVQNLVKDKQI